MRQNPKWKPAENAMKSKMEVANVIKSVMKAANQTKSVTAAANAVKSAMHGKNWMKSVAGATHIKTIHILSANHSQIPSANKGHVLSAK